MTRAAQPADLSHPRLYRVVDKVWEHTDTATLSVVPLEGALPSFEPAQASMVGAFGVGEAAISISSRTATRTHHSYTIRAAGPITRALVSTEVGGTVTIRGPFGSSWPLDRLDGARLLVVAGGLGLAPLRAAMDAALDAGTVRRLDLVYGCRTPGEQLYRRDLVRWQAAGARVTAMVDRPDAEWTGPTGMVTDVLRPASIGPVDPSSAALICGPEAMMRAVTRQLVGLGFDPERVWLSLERNMQCGVARCGHCQLGPFLVCRDGPVVDARALGQYPWIEEL